MCCEINELLKRASRAHGYIPYFHVWAVVCYCVLIDEIQKAMDTREFPSRNSNMLQVVALSLLSPSSCFSKYRNPAKNSCRALLNDMV